MKFLDNNYSSSTIIIIPNNDTQPELPHVAGNIMYQQSLSVNLAQNSTTSLHPS